MSRLLFEDIFEVLDKDPDGKHFDKGVATMLQQAVGNVYGRCINQALQCQGVGCTAQCRASGAAATCMRWTS